MRNIYPYLVFALIIALFYGNTLFNGFVYDDQTFIVNNPLIKDISNLPKVFTTCLTSDSSVDCKGAGVYYHPFLFLQLLLTYQISHSPWFFHLMNLILFFIDSALVYKLTKTVMGQKIWAFLATLFFLINPINSEVGNFISTVNDHYLLIFFVLTFLSFNKFLMLRNRHSGKRSASRISIVQRDAGQASMTALRKVSKFIKTNELFYLILALIFYFLDLLAKEAALFLFVPILIYQFVAQAKTAKRLNLAKLSFIFLLPLIAYYFLRVIIFGQLVPRLPGYHDMNLLTQVLTSISIYPLYLFRLIYPLPLNAQADPSVIRTIDWKFYASLVFWVANAYLIYQLVKRGFKLSLLGFSLIFLSLLPILLLINKIGRFIFAERYLFLATVGFSLIVFELLSMSLRGSRLVGRRSNPIGLRLLLRHLTDRNDKKGKKSSLSFWERARVRVFLSLLAVYLVTSWFTVFNRNKDWHDEFSFNKSIAKYAKENFGVYYNLGGNYFDVKDYENATRSFKKAIAINPDFWEAHFNLANTYLRLQKQDKAENEYKAVILLNPKIDYARNAIDNIRLIKSGTLSANFSLTGETIQYKSDPTEGSGLSFDFPVGFILEKKAPITIKGDSSFTIEITVDSVYDSPTQYLNSNKETKGQLINQGLAQIPQFDFAYVKIFIDQGVQKHQFFLFSKDKVVKVLVYPSDSWLMKLFDVILGSITTQ